MTYRFIDAQRLWERWGGALYGGDAACGCREEGCPLCSANFGMGALRLESSGQAVELGRAVSDIGRSHGLGGDPVGVNSLEQVASAGSGDYAPLGFLSSTRGPSTLASTSSVEGGWEDPRIPGNTNVPNLPEYMEVSDDIAPPIPAILYVSAGPKNETGSCDFSNKDNCSIYKVTLDPQGTKVRYRVDRVACTSKDGGVYDPAVSPDGNKLAYVKQTSLSKEGHLDLLFQDTGEIIQEIVTGTNGDAIYLGFEHSPPLFPAWFGENLLLYAASAGGFQVEGNTDDENWTVYGVEVYNSRRVSSTPVAYLGLGSSYDTRRADDGETYKTAFSDPSVLKPGLIRDSSDFYEMLVVTQGASEELRVRDGSSGYSKPHTEKKAIPRVSALFNRSAPISTQEFDLGRNRSGERITEAHHADWSPVGKTILAYVHEPTERLDSSGKESRLLYVYRQWTEGGNWGDPERAFPPKSPTEILSDLNPGGKLFSEEADLFFHKYAQFCFQDYIIFPLFCTKSSTRELLGSRTMVVRRSDGTYWDITSLVEDWYSCARGELRGYTSTCVKCTESFQ